MTYPLDIILFSPGLPHDGATLAQRSLGGSESAAIHVSKALAARGHHVTVFSPCQAMLADGVQWMPIEHFPGYASTVPHDATIVSRAAEHLRFQFASALRVLWCHDLALKRARQPLYGALWSTDAVFVLSPFMLRQYREVYEGIPESVYLLTRNGIDLRAFQHLRLLPRDRTKLVYGSRPERGLEQCLNIMDELRRRKSPLRLEVSCYDNTVPQMAPLYEQWYARARAMPNVVLKGALKQDEWHRQLATSLALIYPSCGSAFREISCLAVAESMACATPIVAARKGALPDTIGDGPALFLGDETTDPNQLDYIRSFADALDSLHADELLWRRLSEAGRTRASELDWSGVAAQWEAWCLGKLAERAASPERVETWFRRIGEREAVG